MEPQTEQAQAYLQKAALHEKAAARAREAAKRLDPSAKLPPAPKEDLAQVPQLPPQEDEAQEERAEEPTFILTEADEERLRITEAKEAADGGEVLPG